MSSKKTNPIPPWERIAVDAGTAASMLSIGRSTFFTRVKAKVYPPPGPDGRWSVSELRRLFQASGPTTT
jgi:predicted DNA-binding transcriptional regulator AlpA